MLIILSEAVVSRMNLLTRDCPQRGERGALRTESPNDIPAV